MFFNLTSEIHPASSLLKWPVLYLSTLEITDEVDLNAVLLSPKITKSPIAGYIYIGALHIENPMSQLMLCSRKVLGILKYYYWSRKKSNGPSKDLARFMILLIFLVSSAGPSLDTSLSRKSVRQWWIEMVRMVSLQYEQRTLHYRHSYAIVSMTSEKRLLSSPV